MREMEETGAEAIIGDMARLQGSRCPDCSAALCGHQALMNIAMGFKDAPRCVKCLAAALERELQSFRSSLIEYLQQRECYRTAWAWADRNEAVPCPAIADSCAPNLRLLRFQDAGEVLSADAEWDAGDMGCGDLVLELRRRLQNLRAGQIMKLCARDPGAPEDLPAWCRLTGHILLRADHPTYFIKRKE